MRPAKPPLRGRQAAASLELTLTFPMRNAHMERFCTCSDVTTLQTLKDRVCAARAGCSGRSAADATSIWLIWNMVHSVFSLHMSVACCYLAILPMCWLT